MILFIDAIVHKLSSSKSVFSFQFNLSFLCKCDLVYEERLNWKLKKLLDELNLWTIAWMDKIMLLNYVKDDFFKGTFSFCASVVLYYSSKRYPLWFLWGLAEIKQGKLCHILRLDRDWAGVDWRKTKTSTFCSIYYSVQRASFKVFILYLSIY